MCTKMKPFKCVQKGNHLSVYKKVCTKRKPFKCVQKGNHLSVYKKETI